MGPSRGHGGATWMQPSLGGIARRPSWLAPPAAVEPVVRLSCPPRPRRTSLLPPAFAGGARGANERRMSDPGGLRGEAGEPRSTQDLIEEVERRDEAIRAMTVELAALRATAGELAGALATTRRRLLEASEGELVRLALDIAARVVGQQIDADPSQIVGWARDALATLPARETMIVAIAPDLAELVPDGTWAAAIAGAHRIEIDPSLPPATCEIRAGSASIEVSATARLAAVGEAIGAIP